AITVHVTTAGDATLQNAFPTRRSSELAAGTEAADATFGPLGSVTFAGGSGNLATQTVNFTPTADTLVEGNEDATLTPSGPTLNNQVTYTAGTVTIQDGNTATVRVVGQTVNENGAAQQA